MAAKRKVALHPLAIVGISDHFTRVKVGGGKQAADTAIIGLLFGKQSGLEISIFDAIELVWASTALDEEFLVKQTELFTAVYKDRELLGWYTVAKEATPDHLALHKDFLKYTESPLFLMMDPSGSELPITIFEYELHMVNDAPTMLFVAVPYELETLQAEQIAMEQVSKTTPTGESAFDAHLETVDSSLKTLREKVALIVKYLDLLNEGRLPVDFRLLRQINSLCDQLPTPESPDLKHDFAVDLNDALAVSCLASVTKTADAVSDLVENFAVIHTHAANKLA